MNWSKMSNNLVEKATSLLNVHYFVEQTHNFTNRSTNNYFVEKLHNFKQKYIPVEGYGNRPAHIKTFVLYHPTYHMGKSKLSLEVSIEFNFLNTLLEQSSLCR